MGKAARIKRERLSGERPSGKNSKWSKIPTGSMLVIPKAINVAQGMRPFLLPIPLEVRIKRRQEPKYVKPVNPTLEFVRRLMDARKNFIQDAHK